MSSSAESPPLSKRYVLELSADDQYKKMALPSHWTLVATTRNRTIVVWRVEQSSGGETRTAVTHCEALAPNQSWAAKRERVERGELEPETKFTATFGGDDLKIEKAG